MLQPCGLPTTITRVYDHFWAKNDKLKLCIVPTITVRESYNVTAMCLRATGLRFFQICHCAQLNKIVEAKMPVNTYDDRKVSLRRPKGNGDLDIVFSSYGKCNRGIKVQQIK